MKGSELTGTMIPHDWLKAALQWRTRRSMSAKQLQISGPEKSVCQVFTRGFDESNEKG
jgi:hypothetical protein